VSVLYTLAPIELVLAGIDQEGPQYQEIEIGEARLLVEQQSMDRCRVVRLISSNPMDYLRNEFQPGTELKFVPRFADKRTSDSSFRKISATPSYL